MLVCERCLWEAGKGNTNEVGRFILVGGWLGWQVIFLCLLINKVRWFRYCPSAGDLLG